MKLLTITHGLPSRAVTNDGIIEDIVQRSRHHLPGSKAQFMQAKLREAFETSGTKIRYLRAEGERAFDIALKVGQQALHRAGVHPEEVDLLIYAGVGRGWLEPATANVFQAQLGLKRATCFDVMDACASWLRSLTVAQSFIDQGTYKTVMILNAEFNQEFGEFEITQLRDLTHLFASYTIGEAATATLLTADGSPGNFYFSFRTWGDMYHLCQIPLPNAAQYMPDPAIHNHHKPLMFFAQARELLAFGVDKLVDHIREDRHLSQQTHDIIFGHDISEFATTKTIQLTNLDPARVFRTHARFGNTVSASIPLGMSVALDEERLLPGMKVLLLCASAGVSTGLCSFTYGP